MNDAAETTYADGTHRKNLLSDALGDISAASDAASQGDWLRAGILLKLALDEIFDAGGLP